MATDDPILVTRDGVIATVVLNRPHKLNALTKAMWGALGMAIDALSADDDVRCIVVRGAGERAFSPGNDIGEFATERSNKAQAIDYGRAMHGTAAALANCRHPLVAQIHGLCVGGGLEIAALCDLRICGESSRFGAPVKNLGLVMAYPELAPLVRLAVPPWRWKSCWRGASSTRARRTRSGSSRASSPMPTSRSRRERRRSASPRARRWQRAGTSASRGVSPIRAR